MSVTLILIAFEYRFSAPDRSVDAFSDADFISSKEVFIISWFSALDSIVSKDLSSFTTFSVKMASASIDTLALVCKVPKVL